MLDRRQFVKTVSALLASTNLPPLPAGTAPEDAYAAFRHAFDALNANARSAHFNVFTVLKTTGVENLPAYGAQFDLTGYRMDAAKLRRINPADFIRSIRESPFITGANELKKVLLSLFSDEKAKQDIAKQLTGNLKKQFNLTMDPARWLSEAQASLQTPLEASPEMVKEIGTFWEHASGVRPSWATHTREDYLEFARKRAVRLMNEGRTNEMGPKEQSALKDAVYCETSTVKGLPTNYRAVMYVRPDQYQDMRISLRQKDYPANSIKEGVLERKNLGYGTFSNPLFAADKKLDKVHVFTVEDAGTQLQKYLDDFARECKAVPQLSKAG